MNLALEYLQRSGDIQNFLKFPCSLFLENSQEERIVVTIQEADQDKICITRWFLSECEIRKRMPPHKISTINRDFVFQSRQIMIHGFKPLEYQEQFPPSARNRYNRPMPEGVYLNVLDNCLNSYPHKRFRENWLWKAFCLGHKIPSRYNFLRSRLRRDVHGIIATEEQEEIRKTSLWDRWRNWRRKMVWNQEVASELIFASSFSSLPRILLCGEEDMP